MPPVVMTTIVSDPLVNNYKLNFPTLILLATASQCLCQNAIIKGFRFVRSIYLKASKINVAPNYYKVQAAICYNTV